MTAWFVRAADPVADADLIVAIERRAFGRASWGEKSLREGLAAPLVSAFVVARAPALPAEGFALWRRLGEEGEILSFAVAPEARREGLARALLSEVMVSASAEGVAAMFLEVDAGNAPAIALYKSAGFQQVGRRRRYYRNGADALVLHRAL